MIFTELPLKGAFLVEMKPQEDERGFFARTFCTREFEEHGLNPRVVQCNLSFNREKGTLRGMHFQRAPFGEAKLVRCSRGSLYDIIIDLRYGSPTFGQHFSIELVGGSPKMLYIAEGFAHGFQTLSTQTEILYQMSEAYRPEAGSGVRWNDPALRLEWPRGEKHISDQDNHWPLLSEIPNPTGY